MEQAAAGGDTTTLRNIFEKRPNYATVRFRYVIWVSWLCRVVIVSIRMILIVAIINVAS